MTLRVANTLDEDAHWHGRKTADFASAAGENTNGARLVTGLRLWF